MEEKTKRKRGTRTNSRPWNQLLTNLANLFKVKTIVTLIVILTLCFMTMRGLDIPNEFIMIATAVITYYFTRKNGENNGKDDE